ncbi:sushi, von Willebrand factor type A, EGF and pentraxin domain-containing protein 1-like isoform X8 [Chiloscyllium plagiosum]|uniref:sushi, von Willebrand factor type A, EGF and pentraxin domain-containing protein 1-like isoform X8 n=1 Tax=Chiloscyllium plagiosum TaxID=36176 RepID=UPI001CB7F635|nr:sushi, von Willebrand factor type A, EGF and pentraxin domain-containing protein 1-like isoform X8 [Chiloscyllium plagiosum]
MLERLILALMAIGVTRVTGDCSKPPLLENGFPTNKFTPETLFDVGTEITYKCNLGYVFKKEMLNGSRSVTCKEDSTWTALEVICESKICGNPGKIANGYYEAPNATFGSKVIFHCDTGYKMVGRSFRVCKADGWDGQIPACEVVECQRPELPANGKIKEGFGPKYRYRETISYICNEGFEMVGDHVIECKENNTFIPAPPICKPRNCGNPGNILNGYYELRNASFETKATFYCNEGYRMVGRNLRLCKADGWDGQVPTCEVISCDLPLLNNGTVSSPSSGDQWEPGMVANYSCDNGYSLIGAERLTCMASGKWDKNPPTCRESKMPLTRKIGETKEKPPATIVEDEGGLGTTGIVVSCIIGICVGIGGAAGLSFYNKKRQRTMCKKVHINPQPSENQVEANVNEYHDHPA